MIIHPNHNGRTATGRYTYRPKLEPEPDDFHPDSVYWRRRAQGAVDELIGELGAEAAEDWFDEVFPEGTTPSWKDIEGKAREKLHSLSVAEEAEKS